MIISVSEYIARFLKTNGVSFVFELSGGMIMHLMDAIEQESDIHLINVYHEQSAAFAADVVGRVTGIPGVALGTSGPGAINLLTGIGSSYFDSSPALFITGQVNRHEQKGDKNIRQLGFQETDIVSMARPVTKWAEKLIQPEEIKELLPLAFALATNGRPGPCLLDIPMDIFRAPIEVEKGDFSPKEIKNVRTKVQSHVLQELIQSLKVAKRPLILAGNGVHASGNREYFKSTIEKLNVPVVTSLLACDLLAVDHPFRVGMIGTYGNRWANHALAESDFIIIIGSRLDIRQTGSDTESFVKGKKIYHIDIDSSEINNRVSNCVAINQSISDFLSDINNMAEDFLGNFISWSEQINILRNDWPDTAELQGIEGINPNVLMHKLSNQKKIIAYAVDVGMNQMWAAQSIEFDGVARFLTSGGMGAMGFALPAGIAVAIQNQGAGPVMVIAGDAGFQLNIQELQSIAHLKLPIKIVILNNNSHGMTRQFQDTYFDSRYSGTIWGYSAPSFVRIAEAYGIKALYLENMNMADEVIDQFLSDPLQPMLLEVYIDQHVNVYPKIAFGRPISEMEPFASPIAMEGT